MKQTLETISKEDTKIGRLERKIEKLKKRVARYMNRCANYESVINLNPMLVHRYKIWRVVEEDQ